MNTYLSLTQCNMEVHEKIRAYRITKGYSQEFVAIQLDIDTVNYGRIERGQAKISVERLEKISKIFGVHISYFFSNTELNERTELLRELQKLRTVNEQILLEINNYKPKV